MHDDSQRELMLRNYRLCIWYARAKRRQPPDEALDFASWYVAKYPARPVGNIAYAYGWYMAARFGDPKYPSTPFYRAIECAAEVIPNIVADLRSPIRDFEDWEEAMATTGRPPPEPITVSVTPKRNFTPNLIPALTPELRLAIEALDAPTIDKTITLRRLERVTLKALSEEFKMCRTKIWHVVRRTLGLVKGTSCSTY